MTVKPLLDAWRDYISLRSEPEVSDWFKDFDWSLSERNLSAETVPGMRHLETAIDHTGKAEKRLVETFIEFAPRLQWLRSYTAEDFGEYFIENYGHVEIIGTRGHFMSDQIAGGLVLFGPNIDYPDHWHVAEELYFPMTHNGLWSKDRGEFAKRSAGEFIYHESNMAHAMKTEGVPLLALWVWRGGDLAQKGNY